MMHLKKQFEVNKQKLEKFKINPAHQLRRTTNSHNLKLNLAIFFRPKQKQSNNATSNFFFEINKEKKAHTYRIRSKNGKPATLSARAI